MFTFQRRYAAFDAQTSESGGIHMPSFSQKHANILSGIRHQMDYLPSYGHMQDHPEAIGRLHEGVNHLYRGISSHLDQLSPEEASHPVSQRLAEHRDSLGSVLHRQDFSEEGINHAMRTIGNLQNDLDSPSFHLSDYLSHPQYQRRYAASEVPQGFTPINVRRIRNGQPVQTTLHVKAAPGKLSIHDGKRLDEYETDEKHDSLGNRHISVLSNTEKEKAAEEGREPRPYNVRVDTRGNVTCDCPGFAGKFNSATLERAHPGYGYCRHSDVISGLIRSGKIKPGELARAKDKVSKPQLKKSNIHPMLQGTRLAFHLLDLKAKYRNDQRLGELIDNALKGQHRDIVTPTQEQEERGEVPGGYSGSHYVDTYKAIGERLAHYNDPFARAYRWNHMSRGLNLDQFTDQAVRQIVKPREGSGVDESNFYDNVLKHLLPTHQSEITDARGRKHQSNITAHFADSKLILQALEKANPQQQQFWERLKTRVKNQMRDVGLRLSDVDIIRSLVRHYFREQDRAELKANQKRKESAKNPAWQQYFGEMPWWISDHRRPGNPERFRRRYASDPFWDFQPEGEPKPKPHGEDIFSSYQPGSQRLLGDPKAKPGQVPAPPKPPAGLVSGTGGSFHAPVPPPAEPRRLKPGQLPPPINPMISSVSQEGDLGFQGLIEQLQKYGQAMIPNYRPHAVGTHAMIDKWLRENPHWHIHHVYSPSGQPVQSYIASSPDAARAIALRSGKKEAPKYQRRADTGEIFSIERKYRRLRYQHAQPIRYSEEDFHRVMHEHEANGDWKAAAMAANEYTNWLDENGKPASAEFIRMHNNRQGDNGYSLIVNKLRPVYRASEPPTFGIKDWLAAPAYYLAAYRTDPSYELHLVRRSLTQPDHAFTWRIELPVKEAADMLHKVSQEVGHTPPRIRSGRRDFSDLPRFSQMPFYQDSRNKSGIGRVGRTLLQIAGSHFASDPLHLYLNAALRGHHEALGYADQQSRKYDHLWKSYNFQGLLDLIKRHLEENPHQPWLSDKEMSKVFFRPYEDMVRLQRRRLTYAYA